MREFLFTGGINGMSLILVLGLAVLIISITEIIRRVSGLSYSIRDRKLMLSIPLLGGIALLFGMFYQVLGLYQAYQAIKAAADISPMIVMGGVFVSFYSTLFGLGVCLFSLILWYAIKVFWMEKAD